MASVSTPPLPGGMTVPPWFGWENILVVLLLLVVVGAAFFAVSAAGTDATGRSEWEAWLDARSSRRPDPPPDPPDRPVELLRSDPGTAKW